MPEPNRLLEARRLGRYEAALPTVRSEIAGRFGREKDIARRHLTVRIKLYEERPEFAQIGVVSEGVFAGDAVGRLL